MSAEPSVGIVGGGILGTILALRLAQAGADVTLLERAPALRRPRGERWTSAATRSTASTTSSCPRTSACSRSPRRSGSATSCGSRPVGVGLLHRRRRCTTSTASATSCASRRCRPGPAGAARLVRRCSASCARATPASRTCRSRPGCAATAARRSTERIWSPLLDSRFEGRHGRAAGDLPVGAHPPHVAARATALGRRGVRSPRGGPPAADRGPTRAGACARSSDACWRSCRGARGRGRRGRRRARRRRGGALRPHDRRRCSRQRCPSAAGGARQPARRPTPSATSASCACC